MDYSRQYRGDAQAYERYLLAMDGSMRQKVALTAAHLLCEGRIADMGMGSGAGSEALASLYPALEVVGVDVSKTMVELARGKYTLPNLSFVEGDIAKPVFPDGSLDGVFDSSVLHHVTSFSGYDRGAAARALAVQMRALKEHGVLIVRDFLDPGPGTVLLDLPSEDGEASGTDPEKLSTAALFERFAREFRAQSAAPGFAFEAVLGAAAVGLAPGFRRFRTSFTHAAEFLLRKDYRADWAAEVLEEYTYMTQTEFEDVYARLGLRVLASTPLYNPSIIRHRLEGKCALSTEANEPLDTIATNYIVVGEKVAPGEGVRFREGAAREPLGFLSLSTFRQVESGALWDLVRRPHRTVDVVPFFAQNGALYVLARTSYPRPILGATEATAPIDGARPATYGTEPLTLLEEDKPLALTVEEALAKWVAVAPGEILSLARGARYFPSPGGLLEEVQSAWVEIPPLSVHVPAPGVTGFRTSGRVRAIEACQLLRAAQVGGLPDARLEHNVYGLLLARGLRVGPWIGDTIELPEAEEAAPIEPIDAVLARPSRRRFVPAPGKSADFLALRSATFEELDASGNVVAARALDYVVPKTLGTTSVACALLRRQGSDVLVGIDDDNLPAAQCFDGSSALFVAPAWRLPRSVRTRSQARAFVVARLLEEYGAVTQTSWDLGGRYHPSPGATPEVVHAFALAITAERPGARRLTWVRLVDAVARIDAFPDGHLRTVLLRAAHALGLLP